MLTPRLPCAVLGGLLLLAPVGCEEDFTDRFTADNARVPVSRRGTHPDTRGGDLEKLARRIAREHGLDPDFVAAVVDVESGWNARAVSSKGARGLMQLMPATARDRFGLRAPESLFDPETNLRLGVSHLAKLVGRYCYARLALWAWHAGAGRVDPGASRITPAESRRFVRQVVARYRARTGRDVARFTGALDGVACRPKRQVKVAGAPGLTEARGLTEPEPDAPAPVITNAWASALTTRVGEPVEIRLEGQNRGGTARRGTLTVTLTEHPKMRLGFRSDLRTTFIDRGQTRRSLGSTTVGTSYPTIEGTAEDWRGGDSHTLYLRFVPAQVGRIVLYYRLALEDQDGTVLTYPESSIHGPGTERGRRVEIDVTRTLRGGRR